MPSGSAEPLPGPSAVATSRMRGSGPFFDQELGERWFFGQNAHRIADSTTQSIARKGDQPGRAGETHANGNGHSGGANAPEPFDNRLGFKTKLSDHGELQSGAASEINLRGQCLRQNGIGNIGIAFGKAADGNPGNSGLLNQAAFHHRKA